MIGDSLTNHISQTTFSPGVRSVLDRNSGSREASTGRCSGSRRRFDAVGCGADRINRQTKDAGLDFIAIPRISGKMPPNVIRKMIRNPCHSAPKVDKKFGIVYHAEKNKKGRNSLQET